MQSGKWSEPDDPLRAPSSMVEDLREMHLTDSDSEMESMEQRLHAATVEPDEGKEWLPASALDDICNRSDVLRELEKLFQADDAKEYANYVCGSSGDPPNESQSSRRIFAILVLITRVASLPLFVKADLRDAHLPLIWIDDSRNGLYSPSFHSKKIALSCFWKKDLSLMRNFYQTQWQLIVPFIAKDSDDEVKEYQLHRDTIMPWTDMIGDPLDSGFSKVRQVKIHDAHHTFVSAGPFCNVKSMMRKELWNC